MNVIADGNTRELPGCVWLMSGTQRRIAMNGVVIRSPRAWLLSFLLLGMAVPVAVQAATVEYIHTDALGSVVAVTNSSGQVIESREYEPYGRQLAPPQPADGPGYTGHMTDAVTGMIYMQQRYYDPGIGRFLSSDPFPTNSSTGTNFNRYWYGNSNPYKFIDPDGRIGRCAGGSIMCHGGAVAVFARSPGIWQSSEDVQSRPSRPSFSELAKDYPQGDAYSVFNEIGGKVADNSAEHGGQWNNSCTVRLCSALNQNGYLIPKISGGSVTGGDGHQYIYTVKQMEKYLSGWLGYPISRSMQDGLIDTTIFQGKKGIILFDFGSAASGQNFTGHVDLWNGVKCVGTCGSSYLYESERVSLWELPE